MFPFVPAAIAGLTAAALYKLNSKKLSPDQKRLYDAALVNLRDPDKLRQLAGVFEKEGFRQEADMLYKRAHLKDLPKEIIKARKDIFQKAMVSTNLDIVRKVADAFEQEGATNATLRLREHIAELEALPAPSGASRGVVEEEPKGNEIELTVVEPEKTLMQEAQAITDNKTEETSNAEPS